MKYLIHDHKYQFDTLFNSETGSYVRTGILDENGCDTNIDPFMASFPHLIDVGVMGHCIHGKSGLCIKAGIGCYQSGLLVEKPNMTAEAFKWIAEQCRGRCNQIALGGRGDPDQHEQFKELLRICEQNELVPNFTTSGYGMTPKTATICKKYCGAVAVSWYRGKYTIKAIHMLVDAGVKTNIHYVLGRNSIDEAIERLKNNDFPHDINAVIFLLHKPVGQGNTDNGLAVSDSRVAEFFALLDESHPFKVGMDSCSIPGAIQYCKRINPVSLDTCEGGRFSCYIGSDLIMVPCSFDQGKQYGVQLGDEVDIENAWNSIQFEAFRVALRRACPSRLKRELCMGGCALMPGTVLCMSKQRERIGSITPVSSTG